MSMISDQIDELRRMADGQVTYLDARAAMLEAANTIWELRDDLQRANDAVEDAEHDESMAWDRVRKAESENAKLRDEFDRMDRWHSAELQAAMAENSKLRELAEKAWKAAEMLCQAWDGPCHADGVSIKPPCPLDERDELCVYGLIQRDLRELGVEVDG